MGDIETDSFDKVFVGFVKTFFEKYKTSFEIIDKEDADAFEYLSLGNAYLALSMCIAVFRKMCSI